MGLELKQDLRMEMRDRKRRCSVCSGSGVVRVPDNQSSEIECDCRVCDGTGWLPEQQEEASR